jgi:hypothetical protein
VHQTYAQRVVIQMLHAVVHVASLFSTWPDAMI